MYQALLPYPDIDPVLIHLGPLAIRWYALAYISGLLLGWWFIVRMLSDKSLWKNPPFNGKPPATADDIGDLVVWATLGVILGGRIGWVIIYGTILCSVSPDAGFCHGLPGDFLDHPLRLIAVWEGGMSFHGAALGVILAIVLFTRRRKLSLLSVGDLVCAVEPIGQFFGRIANFINGELWGRPTDMPWGMVFCTPHVQATNHGACPAGMIARHPSQLYEAALEGVLLFVILQIGIRVFRWHERPGLLSGIFLMGYAIVRFVVEFFREPDAPFLGALSMGQALSVLFLIGGAYVIWIALQPLNQPTKPKATA
jgi:phosphatidylglycerol:prolipoprotein diacylglycerol transferase